MTRVREEENGLSVHTDPRNQLERDQQKEEQKEQSRLVNRARVLACGRSARAAPTTRLPGCQVAASVSIVTSRAQLHCGALAYLPQVLFAVFDTRTLLDQVSRMSPPPVRSVRHT